MMLYRAAFPTQQDLFLLLSTYSMIPINQQPSYSKPLEQTSQPTDVLAIFAAFKDTAAAY